MSAILWGQAAIVVVIGVVVVVGGVPFIDRMFRFIDRPRRRGEEEQPQLVAAGNKLRGGAWIGALERLFAYGTILAGFPEGVALVIALKSLARYPELRESGTAERFIIGSFLSLILSCGGFCSRSCCAGRSAPDRGSPTR